MSMDGIAGIYSPGDDGLVSKIFLATGAIQHRGKASAGIAVMGKKGIYPHKGLGRIGDVIPPSLLKIMQDLDPIAAIGDVGYTKNRDPAEHNAEPVMISPKGDSALEMAVVMDGYLVQEEDIKAELDHDYEFITRNKTEVVGSLLHKCLLEEGINFEAGKKFIEKISGMATFALTALVYDRSTKKGYLISINDDRAFEPMCYGTIDQAFLVSSESVSHRRLGGPIEKECDGAEMTICSEGGIEKEILGNLALLRDAFQPVYFGHVGSLFKGKPILSYRRELGHGLVRYYGIPEDIDRVIDNPDSGRGVTIGVLEAMKEALEERAFDYSHYDSDSIIHVKDKNAHSLYKKLVTVYPGLIKQAQAVRTFQEQKKSQRSLETGLKFGTVDYLIEDQLVDEGDDSTVKGSVGEGGSIWALHNAGAKKLRRWISYGPMLFPSFKEWHRGIVCLNDLAVQRAFKNSIPYGRSIEETNIAVAALVLSNLQNVDRSWLEFRYNTPEIVRGVVGDGCSYQALGASYPILHRFWPDWLKVHVDLFEKLKA